MKNLILIILIIIITLTYCSQKKTDENKKQNKSEETIDSKVIKIINEKGKYVKTRFNPPKGYVRIKADSNSFGYYLRNLELKPFGSKVLYYNAYEKLSDNVYISVVKMDIGKKTCNNVQMQLCDYVPNTYIKEKNTKKSYLIFCQTANQDIMKNMQKEIIHIKNF